MRISLKNKFLIPTVLLIVIGMSILSIISYVKAKNALKEIIVEQVDQIAESTVGTMSTWTKDRKLDIVNWSRQRTYKMALHDSFLAMTAREFTNNQLVRIKEDYKYYENVVLADSAGDLVAASDPSLIGKINISDRNYFQQSLKGKSFISEDVLKSRATGDLVFVISAPVKDNGEIVGVLLGVLDINYLIRLFIDPLKVGENGYAYIFKKDGIIIAHPDRANILKVNIKDFGFGQDMLIKQEGLQEYVVSGVKQTVAFKKFKEVGWTIVVGAINDEILAPVKSLYRISVLVTVAVAMIVAMVIFFIANSVARPINDIVSGLKEMGKGRLDLRLDLDSNDEIGEIGQALNSMAANLEESEKKLKKQHTLLQEANVKAQRDRAVAEAATRSKSEFLANMSHEIRTPLNAVTGFSELLSAMTSEPKQQSYIEAIKIAGKSLLTLINDILDLSTIEAGMLKIVSAPVNLQILLNEIEQIFRVKIKDKGMQFVVEMAPDLPRVLNLDETRIRQILLNLVGNSLKFTDKGHIELRAERLPGAGGQSRIDLLLTLEDSGIGIPPEDLDKIFESFRQQDGQDSRRFGGTGLGLAICRKLVEAMGGEIRAASEMGIGSTFEVILRDIEVAPLDEVSAIAADSFEVTNTAFAKAGILVVDDIESNRNLLRELLAEVGLDVLTADNGQEALDVIGEYQPDLIIMDIRMPVMDGIEATLKIKADSETSGIPIIALTASTSVEDRGDILAKGFAGYLTKPVSAGRLLAEIAKHLPCSIQILEKVKPNIFSPRVVIEEIERPTEFIAILNNEILSSCQSLQKAIVMQRVEQFAERLQELAKEHTVQALGDYGEELLGAVRIFDTVKIEKKLRDIPEIIERYTAMMEQRNGQ